LEKDFTTKATFLLFLAIVIFLNALGLFNDIMEIDGALYASISKQIEGGDNWLYLWAEGAEWLDKPHLPFWLAACSFKLFGISAFSYKLPSFLFFIVSIFYCYKLSASLYSQKIAQLATLIYATALHTVICNFDGKVEIYLTAFIIGATYHLYKALNKNWCWHLLAAALFCACAIMTKGIFSTVIFASGFIIYWIKTKQWHEFLNPKWYLLILLTLIFILPELYALYTQFDLHPEKLIFGGTHVSGLRFFFWDSQFGRFFNNGPIKGSGDLTFFTHTTLWAFLPWSILLIIAVFKIFSRKNISTSNNLSWIIGGSAMISFLMFSLSKFQLPHYIVSIFPHFAIISAFYMIEIATEKILRKINLFQSFLILLLIISIAWIIVTYQFDSISWFVITIGIAVTCIFCYKSENLLTAIAVKNIGFALILSIFLNCLFYPSLLQYQSGMMAAKWLNLNHISQPITVSKSGSSSFHFYYKGKVIYNNNPRFTYDSTTKNPMFYIASIGDLRALKKDSSHLTILKTFPQFRVSQLNIQFLNHLSRSKTLDTFAIAKIR
jgi:4-amino-4-deoxy-L-arabinose transferase-like glycosyltransferase